MQGTKLQNQNRSSSRVRCKATSAGSGIAPSVPTRHTWSQHARIITRGFGSYTHNKSFGSTMGITAVLFVLLSMTTLKRADVSVIATSSLALQGRLCWLVEISYHRTLRRLLSLSSGLALERYIYRGLLAFQPEEAEWWLRLMTRSINSYSEEICSFDTLYHTRLCCS